MKNKTIEELNRCRIEIGMTAEDISYGLDRGYPIIPKTIEELDEDEFWYANELVFVMTGMGYKGLPACMFKMNLNVGKKVIIPYVTKGPTGFQVYEPGKTKRFLALFSDGANGCPDNDVFKIFDIEGKQVRTYDSELSEELTRLYKNSRRKMLDALHIPQSKRNKYMLTGMVDYLIEALENKWIDLDLEKGIFYIK